MSNQSKNTRHINMAGRELTAIGASNNVYADFYHASMTMRWPVFLGWALFLFIGLNVLFALAFALEADSVANVPEGKWWYLFYFSIETLATVGYGDMHPSTDYGHLLASMETFVGIVLTAVLTGLIFARFARPRARVLASKSILIGDHDGKNSLMLRVANERMNTISDATARLWILYNEQTSEGQFFRRFQEIPLVRNNQPMFVLSWLIMHTIDENSPLFGLSHEDLKARALSFVLIITGSDETITQDIRTRHTYTFEDIVWNHRFADILTTNESGDLTVNYNHFHDTVAMDSAGE